MNTQNYTQKTIEAINTAISMAKENRNTLLEPAHLLYALLDHLHHTVALIGRSRQHNLHDTLLLGIVSQGCGDAYAIGSALVLADGLGI